jgi:phage RecT family recombinase
MSNVELVAFREQWVMTAANVKAMLPSHIPFEAFERVAMVAVQRNPDLLKLDRKKLFLAFQDAAASGLVPDGREGAIVPRKGAPVWQPMVWGITKLARQAGIRKFQAHIVFEGEPFRIVLGDEDRIEHERKIECWGGIDKMVLVYAIAELSDGTIVRRHMPKSKVMAIKAAAPAGGPWGGPHWDEMVVKTGLRFLAKWLPLSTEKEDERRLIEALESEDNHEPIEHDRGAVHETIPAAKISDEGRLDILEQAIAGEVIEVVVVAEVAIIEEPAPELQPSALDLALAGQVAKISDKARSHMEAITSAKTGAEMFKAIDADRAALKYFKDQHPTISKLLSDAARAAQERIDAAEPTEAVA